jgi:hypothetical protein
MIRGRCAAEAALSLGALLASLVFLSACDPKPDPGPSPRAISAGSGGDEAAARRDPVATKAFLAVVGAEKSLAYVGVRSSVRGSEGEARTTASGVRRPDPPERTTRMRISRYGSGRTFLEWDGPVGQTHRWSFRGRFAWLDDPNLLLANYSVAADPAPGPEVAGHATRRLTFRGDRPGRPSLELCVDAATSLVLREEVRDYDGRVWLTNVFESIEYREPDAPPADAAAEAHDDPRGGLDQLHGLPLAVTAPPAGFVRVGGIAGAKGLLREDWSDGLAAFSVVEQPVGGESGVDCPIPSLKDGDVQRRSHRGDTSVAGLFGGTYVCVTGNLPPDDLEGVVRSLARSR